MMGYRSLYKYNAYGLIKRSENAAERIEEPCVRKAQVRKSLLVWWLGSFLRDIANIRYFTSFCGLDVHYMGNPNQCLVVVLNQYHFPIHKVNPFIDLLAVLFAI